MKKLIEDLQSRMNEYCDAIIATENPLEKEYWNGRLDEVLKLKENVETGFYSN